MRKIIILPLLGAGLLAASIGSAAACSYAGMDVKVDGKGNVVELVDDGVGNQVTGRVLGKFNRLQSQIEGSCNVVVTEQRGRGTDVKIGAYGDHHGVGVLASDDATVNIRTTGQGSTIIADVVGGDTTIRNRGRNEIYVRRN